MPHIVSTAMRRARLAGAADDWPPYGGQGPRGSTLGGSLCLRVDSIPALSEAATNYRCCLTLGTGLRKPRTKVAETQFF